MSEAAPKATVETPDVRQSAEYWDNRIAALRDNKDLSAGYRDKLIAEDEAEKAKYVTAEAPAADEPEAPASPEATGGLQDNADKIKAQLGLPETVKSPEEFKEVLLGALGATVSATLSPAMVERLRTEPGLNAIIEDMHANGQGVDLENSPQYIEKYTKMFNLAEAREAAAAGNAKGEATTGTNPEDSKDDDIIDEEVGEEDEAPTGRAGLGARGMTFWANHKAKKEAKRNKRIEDMRAQGFDDEEIQRRLDRGDKVRFISKIMVGAAAVVAAGVALKYGYSHFHGGSGANVQEHIPTPPETPNGMTPDQLKDYFNMPDTSKSDRVLMAHANDFAPSIPNLVENFNKDQGIQHITDMLRGNPKITAMWASQLHIQGAPDMPSMQELQNNDSLLSSTNIKVNEYGDFLQGNSSVRKDVTDQIIDKLQKAEWGNTETMRPGYMSPGANNTATAFLLGSKPANGSAPHEVFMDASVGYSDETGRVVVIDSKPYVLLKCGQLSEQPLVVPHVSQPVSEVAAPVRHEIAHAAPQQPVGPAPTPETPGITPQPQPTPEQPAPVPPTETPVDNPPATEQPRLNQKGQAHPENQFRSSSTTSGPLQAPADVPTERVTQPTRDTGRPATPTIDTVTNNAHSAGAGTAHDTTQTQQRTTGSMGVSQTADQQRTGTVSSR